VLSLPYRLPLPSGAARGFFAAVSRDVLQNTAASFNSDASFGAAVTYMLDTKKQAKQVARTLGQHAWNDERTLNSTRRISDRIDLTDIKLGAVGGAVIAEWIKQHTTITHLGLRGTGLGDDGVAGLAYILEKHPSLTSLDLRKTGVTEKGGLNVLGDVLLCRSSPVMCFMILDQWTLDAATRSLSFVKLDATTATVRLVLGLLGANQTLESLDLDCFGLKGKKAVDMIRNLRGGEISLDLSGLRLGAASAAVIGKCIGFNAVLTTLGCALFWRNPLDHPP